MRDEDMKWRSFSTEAITEMPTVDDVFNSLRSSTYLNPVTVDLGIIADETAIMVRAVVTQVRTLYVGIAELKHEEPIGCYAYPDIEFSGWLFKSGFDPYAGIVRVVGKLTMQGDRPEIVGCDLSFSEPARLELLQER